MAFDYKPQDVQLRHASIRGGDWVPFRLAWPGYAGRDGVAQPHKLEWLWSSDNPFEVGGDWLGKTWELHIALVTDPVGKSGEVISVASPDTPLELLALLRLFVDLPAIQLEDVEGTAYTVQAYSYIERLVEPVDVEHLLGTVSQGGWLVTLKLSTNVVA